MILKVMKRTVNQADTEHPKVTTETSYFDGFDYVTEKHQDIKDVEKPCGAYDASFFTLDNSKYVICLWLMRSSNIVRYLVIDSCYDVYLMSDSGKTIERIN